MKKIIVSSIATSLSFSTLVQNICYPSCRFDQFCDMGKCVLQNSGYGQISGQSNKCWSDANCLANQVCSNRVCVNKGANRCDSCLSHEKCVFGRCIPDENPVVEGCRNNSDCSRNQICWNKKCVASSNGPSQNCRRNRDCNSWQVCRKGTCVSTNVSVCRPKCQPGYYCWQGFCQPQINQTYPQCQADQDCTNYPTQNCIQGQCSVVQRRCQFDGECGLNGKCQGSICVLNQRPCSQGCLAGTRCQNNICVADVNSCPVDYNVKTYVCTQPRPKCPQIFYIRAPDIAYCGVTQNGVKKDFVHSCDACQDKQIVYFFDKPCQITPFVCGPSQTCNGEYCTKQCYNNQDCLYDWQTCIQGKCLDRCATMRCRGNCKYGTCNYQQYNPNITCLGGPACKNEYQTCVGMFCVDLCTRKPCPPNQRCEQGVCVANSPDFIGSTNN